MNNAGTAEIVKRPEFLHLDHADPRRGSHEHVKNRKKLEFLHLEHADPRRGSRAPQKTQKNLEFLHLDHADPRRGSREHVKNRRKPRVFRRSPQRVGFRVVSSALPRRPKRRF